jgi:threonine/homoserine/homoserine lactone efflux protein
MIDTASLPLFLAAVAALLIVPGPDFILISTQSVSRGARYGVACSLGIFFAGLLQTALVAAGLGMIMEAWPIVATIIRLCGAGYLAFLGVKMLLAWRKSGVVQAVAPASQQSARALMVIGLANNPLNPKALLFFSVFIPQFVSPGFGPASHQIAILGGLLSLLALGYNVFLAFLFAMVRSMRVNVSGLQRHSEGVLGLLFLALAARLSWAKAA